VRGVGFCTREATGSLSYIILSAHVQRRARV
jgi:hypothetical protein